MKTENEKWNKLIGKKILLITPNAESVEVAVITGCDPDIGICINYLDDPDPHTIILGPLAPNSPKNVTNEKLIKRKQYLVTIFKMLQSGYYSYPADKVIYNNMFPDLRGSSDISCPYSM